MYWYPHWHLNPEICFPLLGTGCHLWHLHPVFILWIFHRAVASWTDIGTLCFAAITYHKRYEVKITHVVMIGIVSIIFSPCVFMFDSYTICPSVDICY
jgi:hypothetical protein